MALALCVLPARIRFPHLTLLLLALLSSLSERACVRTHCGAHCAAPNRLLCTTRDRVQCI